MDKQDIIHEKYFHVDNGGFFFRVDKYGTTEIEFGFFGYSRTTIAMHSSKDFGVEEIAQFFNKAAVKLEEARGKEEE